MYERQTDRYTETEGETETERAREHERTHSVFQYQPQNKVRTFLHGSSAWLRLLTVQMDLVAVESA